MAELMLAVTHGCGPPCNCAGLSLCDGAGLNSTTIRSIPVYQEHRQAASCGRAQLATTVYFGSALRENGAWSSR
ncbi:hypothetical protein LT85_3069 [Collimonas arenae]|uniref:Uncharacterized protein n=1 Tax=Collimonas arenae TaxID=279058 RepID=A0A0A1FH77_9BURK|nr:hypothetical protein LT85_3069 [Collimonas arenae]